MCTLTVERFLEMGGYAAHWLITRAALEAYSLTRLRVQASKVQAAWRRGHMQRTGPATTMRLVSRPFPGVCSMETELPQI